MQTEIEPQTPAFPNFSFVGTTYAYVYVNKVVLT
jgi:hypothetical protein